MRRKHPTHPIVGVGGVILSYGRDIYQDPKQKPRAHVDDAIYVALIKRGTEPSKGLWTVPGGGIEVGETLHEAVRRELFEEVHVHVEIQDHVETIEAIERDVDGSVVYHFIVFDYICVLDPRQQVVRAGSDAEAVEWVAVDDLDRWTLVGDNAEVIRRAVKRWVASKSAA